ncbi:MAG: adenylate/guanylate cyclase domain-containing protein [Ruegeria sp.]
MDRRLTAILATDVVAYSRLMGADEESTLSTLNVFRALFNDHVNRHGGRVFSSVGDCMMAEFESPVKSVQCAVEFQTTIQKENAAQPESRRMRFRIGINLGDVVAEGENLLGDGVNIAARLEALAPAGGICISKNIADQIVGKIEAEFANVGDHELKNIVEPVEVWAWPPEQAKGLRRVRKRPYWFAALIGIAAVCVVAIYIGLEEKSQPALPTGARIALIPFENVGDDPDDAFFSEGLTRDVNAQIARFSNLFVLAPQAGEAYRDNPDCETIRNELSADYILTGTVRRSANKLRVTTTFLDANTCLQLTPPGPFDRDLNLENLLDIQHEISSKVAAEIGSSDAPLFSVEVQREIRDKGPDSLDAYECVMLGYWFYQTFAAPELRKARECLERAVVDEPEYSLAWSRLAFVYLETKKRLIDTPPNWAKLASDAADNALNADRDNLDAYYALAVLSRMQGEDIEVFREFADRAIELNPNDSWILADLGIFLAYAGEFEEGKQWIERARSLNPRLHRGFNYAWHLHAYAQGDYKEARNIMLNMGPARNYLGMATLTASYAMNGEQEEAEELLARIREMFPDDLRTPSAQFDARGMPEEFVEHLMEGLRRAGLSVPPDEREN